MKIAVIQATTRKNMNSLLVDMVKKSTKGEYEIVNFGIFPNEDCQYSYVEVAIMISLLIETQAVDFVVTGCSSGQGMMLACNSLPALTCGYVATPQDAFLFGRINGGNVASLPLGLNFGWQGDLNLQYTLDKLFDGEFGVGYPAQDAERKCLETQLLQSLSQLTKSTWLDLLDEFPQDLLLKILQRKNVMDYLLKYGQNKKLVEKLQTKM
ncbi:RpiB/LacA/LacB family sugar-phosphate isomerase [Streptococcus massiliensis]|uniref:Ribose/galactose Isomerase n=1 Tax=Streptococcus massiliensis TaxID=313439 RepID=A0A380L1W0_9STRE|nr:RpiB/LacA/LacB family sugar-phosphate isomerase [Streptococcus massiliensis]SUN77438.1 ribose/galactose Isomerase [Streptococcus massiliensis]